ncbi:MAG: InlB B-repeat-containing protein [Oscillospiraceae bacterium]
MKKRILSLVLCAAMLLSMCLFLGAGVTNSLTVCDSSGEAVKRVDLPVNQKISLTAQAQSAAENDAYQWQIRAAKNVWANILGSDTQTLELSYPMVASALSEKNTVQIRCRLTSAETGEATFSDAVTVEVTAATAVDTPASADAAAAPVLHSPAKVAAAVNDAPEYGTYTIIINYQFTDGRQAANQWSATVANGTPFTQDVTSPTVVGYAPDLSVVHVDSSVATTYTVNYHPAQVDFTVKHYKQNVNDDNYTLSDTETKKGITENLVGDGLAKNTKTDTNYSGFYSLLYDTSTKIAADGSTVVEIYYDRYYYLMNFDLDGGYGVEPIYARYGAPINVGNPTKPGYSFDKWEPTLPATMPAENTTHKATWNAGTTSFSVVFWYENADDTNYSYAGAYKVSNANVGAEVKSADYRNEAFDKRDDTHFTYNSDRAETVTVAGDGSTVLNVYFTRNTYTLTFRELNCDKWFMHTHNDSCYKTVKTITAKWNEKISDKFSEAPFSTTYNGRAWKCTDSSKYSYALQTLDRMPGFNATFKLYDQSSYSKKTIYYYVQKVGTTVSSTQWPKNSQNFELLKQVDTYFNFATYNEEYHEIQGFTRYSRQVSGFDSDNQKKFSNNALYLYYMRNSYQLTFYNKSADPVDTKNVQYEAAVKDSFFEPAYPESLEKNAYVFAGWYTSPDGYPGSEADALTMPASDLALYAKWVPITHTVKTYKTENDLNGGTALDTCEVSHGTAVPENDRPDTPKNGEYTFVGWFYKDADGTEHAFDFSMPVTKDLNLYAKWSSNKLMEYTIHYQLEDGTPIADDTKGSALAGSTKTFEAKTGDQLNDGYRSGYFPKTSSHSITMDIKDPTQNEYTFVYVKMPEVKYTVRYLDKATGNPVVVNGQPTPDKTETTSNAVVTETFRQIPGYAPDAYQKRLVLSANDKENVLVFWYTKDEVHAPVQIVHEIQNIEGPGYTEYQSSTNLNGVIGEKYDGTPLTIPGFRYNKSASTASGKLTAAGLVLTLKYDRIKYPYEFRFLEQGTDTELRDPVTDYARYQAQVTETAPSIPGYTLVGDRSQSMVIQIEDPANEAKKNVKIFYYTEKTVDIKYQVVGPDGSGTLDKVQDSNVKVLSGTVKGSTPTPNAGYKFVGWYKDEGCTQPVDKDWVNTDTNKLMPQQVNDIYEEATYYAKFERDVFNLTIEKKAANGSKIDQNQTFVFRVQGEGVNMQVVITGEAQQVIKNLPVGDYTITEDTSWSWKYTPVDGDEKTLMTSDIEKGAATVTFKNKNNGTNWLTSIAEVINKWISGQIEQTEIKN